MIHPDNDSSREAERFRQLLDQIRRKVIELKRDNLTLAEENAGLIRKLEQKEKQKGSKDVFSTLGDSERIALRHQIDGLIAKIDHHLKQ